MVDDGVCNCCGQRFVERTRKRPAYGKAWAGILEEHAKDGVCPRCFNEYGIIKNGVRDWTQLERESAEKEAKRVRAETEARAKQQRERAEENARNEHERRQREADAKAAAKDAAERAKKTRDAQEAKERAEASPNFTRKKYAHVESLIQKAISGLDGTDHTVEINIYSVCELTLKERPTNPYAFLCEATPNYGERLSTYGQKLVDRFKTADVQISFVDVFRQYGCQDDRGDFYGVWIQIKPNPTRERVARGRQKRAEEQRAQKQHMAILRGTRHGMVEYRLDQFFKWVGQIIFIAIIISIISIIAGVLAFCT